MTSYRAGHSFTKKNEKYKKNLFGKGGGSSVMEGIFVFFAL
jgi:hypothetical protein